MSKTIKIAIQGGKCSFNEIALQKNLEIVKKSIAEDISKQNVSSNIETKDPKEIELETIYSYTTKAVFEAIESGTADYGQFAIHNLTGLLVKESLDEIEKHIFSTLSYYTLEVKHYLMQKKGNATTPKVIMGHSQVLIQCEKTLKAQYPDYELIAGTGDLTDNSSIAEYTASTGEVYCLASKHLVEAFDLELVSDQNLADDQKNYTTFMLVRK